LRGLSATGGLLVSVTALAALSTACGGRMDPPSQPDAIDGATSGPSVDAGIDGPARDSGTMEDGGSVDAADTGASNDASESDGSDAASLDIATACLVSNNRFVIAGDDYIYSGPPLIFDGAPTDVGWNIIPSTVNSDDNRLPSSIGVGPPSVDNWLATFSTESLGQSLTVGTYTGAQLAGAAAPAHPGLDVHSINKPACDTVTGEFRVIELTTDVAPSGVPIIKSFTATFVQHCNGGTASNVGCVHVSE
jgi:hypothetical protein